MLVVVTHTKKKKYIIYIYMHMFLPQGLFAFPEERDKTVY